jgi:hypothetical protein
MAEKAGTQVQQLMAELLADPAGEAAQVVRTMLLGYTMKDWKQEEQVVRELQNEKEARVVLEQDVGALAVGNLNAHTRNLRLADELREAQSRHGKIGECILQARRAQAAHRPFDYERALNQISAVIGLRGGEEFLHDEQAAKATDD